MINGTTLVLVLFFSVGIMKTLFSVHLTLFGHDTATGYHPSVCLSVCLSVCPSVTFWCFVQTNEDTIVRFSASGRTFTLVSWEVKFIWIFAGDHPSEVIKVEYPSAASIDSENFTDNCP